MSVISSPCLICGSKDNMKTFDDGGQWCFTPQCEANKTRSKTKEISEVIDNNLVIGTFSALPKRRISRKTCEFFNYMGGVCNGESVQIANFPGGVQQLRFKDKRFEFRGDKSQISLWGKQKWSNTGKTIIITEGQIDAMSIAEAQDCKWPVVSLPNGAASARKSLQKDLDWLLGFKHIILAFDNDEAGKIAKESVTDLFPPGRLKISSLSEKDANDCLVKGKYQELVDIIWNAQEYRPDGIVWGKDIDFKELYTQKPRGLSLPYPALDNAIRGLKDGRIYTIFAGTGNGKSTTMREMALHLQIHHPGIKIANIFLEESLGFTALSYIAMKNNIPAFKVEEKPDLLSTSQREEGAELISTMAFYRHFGSLDSKRLFNLLDYMVIGSGVKVIFLDHISILVSGMKSESGEGERRDIDLLLTNLRSFCERTQAIIVCATQLKRKNKSYSEGETITESDARGSGAIEHLSDVVFALNCDSYGDDPYDAQITIIKNRVTGFKGKVDLISYNPETGRYLPKKLEISKDGGMY